VRNALGSVQSVLVLGGGSEIALATVRALVADGAGKVILAARRPAELEPHLEQIEAAGAATLEALPFDAKDVETHQQFVDDVFDRHGDIDLVLLAFGVLGDQAELEADPAAAFDLVETNFAGAVSVSLAAVRRLKQQGHGTLVVLSSVAGERVRKSNFVYGSSKAGLDGFAQGLGDSLDGTGIDVMVVRPGFVKTKMTAGIDPAPLSTTPEAVADAIAAGLRRRAHTVWVPPVLRFVMAALRHLPRPLFRRLDL
jgi:decaprenylphospho-beta-D-erythro-pentofuranosid-2-ulose 2-reductase